MPQFGRLIEPFRKAERSTGFSQQLKFGQLIEPSEVSHWQRFPKGCAPHPRHSSGWE